MEADDSRSKTFGAPRRPGPTGETQALDWL